MVLLKEISEGIWGKRKKDKNIVLLMILRQYNRRQCLVEDLFSLGKVKIPTPRDGTGNGKRPARSGTGLELLTGRSLEKFFSFFNYFSFKIH